MYALIADDGLSDSISIWIYIFVFATSCISTMKTGINMVKMRQLWQYKIIQHELVFF